MTSKHRKLAKIHPMPHAIRDIIELTVTPPGIRLEADYIRDGIKVIAKGTDPLEVFFIDRRSIDNGNGRIDHLLEHLK